MTAEPLPTDPVRTRSFGARWRAGWGRVRGSVFAIMQIVVAATAAYALARGVIGHDTPLLALTVTVSSLGLVRDARPRRVVETVGGMIVGILVSELIVLVAGSGWWQLAIALAVTMAFARLLSPQASFAIAAAVQAIIVLILPSSAPGDRLIDGMVGGVVAIVATGLIPRDPVRPAQRDAAEVLAAFDNALGTVVQALKYGSRERAARGLEKARDIHGLVEDWKVSLESARAIARVSPFLRRRRGELERQTRIQQHIDFATRNLRVIARRAVYLVDDGRPREEIATLLLQLTQGAALVGRCLADADAEEPARAAVIRVAERLDPAALLPDGSLGAQNLVAALRPLATDLLAAAGMDPAEARAVLPRI